MLAELIEEFTEGLEGVSFYPNYSGRMMFGKTCPGIVVDRGINYLEVLMSLTRFLESRGFDEYDKLLNPSIDSLGQDVIVYFVSAKNEETCGC